MIVLLNGLVQDQPLSAPYPARPPQDQIVPAGESGEFRIAVAHQDGTAYSLAGCVVLLTAKKASGGAAVLTKTVTLTLLQGLDGTATFAIAAADTRSLAGAFVYDVWLTPPSPSAARIQVVPTSRLFVQAAVGQPA